MLIKYEGVTMQPVGSLDGSDISMSAGSQGLVSCAGQFEHSVASNSPSMQCFVGVPNCVVCRL